MEELNDFSDDRLKGWCIHCGTWKGDADFTSDHVPSKTLLMRPLPAHTPQVAICHSCNNRLSLDEEYLKVFMTCVFEGTCEPDAMADQKVARALRRNGRLAAELRQARRQYETLGGDRVTVWDPDIARIVPPLVKNAKGHFYFEMGQAPEGEPVISVLRPLQTMTGHQRNSFEAATIGDGWPEVGSRLFDRVVSGADMDDAWIVVQDGVYRYAIHEFHAVRIVLREYLAFEAVWQQG